MSPLLQHVLDDSCDDPDCELHHADVGVEEGTVGEIFYAFFLAGVSWLPRGDANREWAFQVARMRFPA